MAKTLTLVSPPRLRSTLVANSNRRDERSLRAVAADGLTEEQGQLQTPCQRVQHFFCVSGGFVSQVGPFFVSSVPL